MTDAVGDVTGMNNERERHQRTPIEMQNLFVLSSSRSGVRRWELDARMRKLAPDSAWTRKDAGPGDPGSLKTRRATRKRWGVHEVQNDLM